jgi:hypothetical protein
MECGAKKRDGTPCKAAAMQNGRCRIHGGKSLSGVASPTFKTGRYSQHLPQELLTAYERSQSDPELLAVREDISLLDSLLISNLTRLETGESGKAWQTLIRLINQIDKAFANENYGEVMINVRMLRELADNRMEQFAVEEEIRSKLEQRRRLVESERDRLIKGKMVIEGDRAVVLISALLDSVKRNVTDRDTLSAIQSDFIRLTQGQDQPRASIGGGG